MPIQQQIDDISTNIGQVRSVEAYLRAKAPNLANVLLKSEALLTNYRDSLKATLKSQDLTDPAWHDA